MFDVILDVLDKKELNGMGFLADLIGNELLEKEFKKYLENEQVSLEKRERLKKLYIAYKMKGI